ncbi:MAG: hypothetical protein JNK79_18595 [Chitinophagaceae bacterium]|nr:hypothetical protein [Chitinophagaceae bacterium]
MRVFSALLLWILAPLVASSQLSDFISVQKKNGRIVKNFGVGSPITFLTSSGSVQEGIITQIRNDSVFLRNINVRQMYTSYGGVLLDTVSFLTAWHYSEIARVRIFRYRGHAYNRAADLLMIGGGGYFILNVVNGLYRGENLGDKDYIVTLGSSALAFGAGWLLRKHSPNNFTRKNHRIKYINMR